MQEKFNVIKSRNISIISITILISLVVMMFLYVYYYPGKIGPEQPIHFSHKIHANDKQISCFMCHDGAIDTRQADIPSLQTCMLCHERIIIQHPEIQNLRSHYYKNEPVMWERVNRKVPDFVFFNHSMHIFRKIDCSRCHGDVKAMDRIKRFNKFKMGFCVRCHKDYNASRDCYACHR